MTEYYSPKSSRNRRLCGAIFGTLIATQERIGKNSKGNIMDIQATTSSSQYHSKPAVNTDPYIGMVDKTSDGYVIATDRDGNRVVGKKLDLPPAEFILNKLSPEILASMLKFQQTMDEHSDHRMSEIEAEKAGDTQTKDTLRISTRNDLDDIANDPVYAAKRARELGTLPQLTLIAMEDFPKNGDPASVWGAFHAKMSAQLEQNGQVTRDRSNYYHEMIAEGLPPAEIYAKLLEFNANLSQSYSDASTPKNSYASGGYKANNQSQYEFLMNALGKPVGPPEQSA